MRTTRVEDDCQWPAVECFVRIAAGVGETAAGLMARTPYTTGKNGSATSSSAFVNSSGERPYRNAEAASTLPYPVTSNPFTGKTSLNSRRIDASVNRQ